MAATERWGDGESAFAGADLRTKQYFVVDLGVASGTSRTVVLGNGKGYGILQNKPNTGEAAAVMTDGISQLVVDATTDIGVGDKIGVDANGKGIKVTADKAFYIGVARSAAMNDNDRISVRLEPGYLAV